MGQDTKIEWAHHTFNPWTGCTKISQACDHCYAEGWSKRAGDRVGKWGPGAPRVRTTDANWKQPLRWNAEAERLGVRYRVFCASLADVFDNEVPPAWRAELFALIDQTPNLDWLLLTKRIGNVAKMIEAPGMQKCGLPPNVWIGASITSQAEADRDIPKLLAVPAAKRFLSMEPLLGPVDLGAWIGDESCHVCRTRFYGDEMNLRPGGVKTVDFEDQPEDENDIRKVCPNCQTINTCGEVDVVDEEEMGGGIDWIIVGGESGPSARPMHPDWARSLRDQCQAAGVPFLFKQWGEWLPWHHFCDAGIEDGDGQQPTRFATLEWSDNEWHDVGKPDYWDSMDGAIDDQQCVGRVGKKAAGRLLDGRDWNEVP